ncbi:retrovirus-related pol polyprotein from transposon TNT 1-94 [Tanacetum coccineum]
MNKAMAFLSAVFTPRYPSANNQLRSSSNLRNQATVQDGRVTIQHVQGRQGQNVVGSSLQGNASGSRGNTSGQVNVIKCYNYQGEGHMARQCTQPQRRRDASWFKENTDDLDAYDSDYDDISSAKVVLMANLSSFDSDVLSEEIVQNTNTSAQQNFMILSMFEQMSNHANNWDKANNETQRIKTILYDGNVLSKTYNVLSVVDDEETLILVEESRLKMVEKQNDPIMKKEKINITLINYFELNKLSKGFGKCFVPLQELSAKQKFWLQSFDKNSEEPSTSNTPVKIEVPSELPKVSLVNKSLKKLRFHLASFDKVVKVRTTPDAITEGSWDFEHTKKVFLTEIITWLHNFKDFFNEFDKGLLDEITEVQTVFTQMEAAVEQCSVDRKCCEIQQK